MKKLFSLKTEKRTALTIVIYVFAFVFVRYLCYGYTYFYQLDDYIQYWAYPTRPDRWGVVLEQGLLSSRPLAGLSDIYFWGNFFEGMIVAVLIISALYALSAVLFLRVFKKHFKTGAMFVFFYALIPFFYEAVYWISASSRIVIGLFFTSASVFFLQKYFESKKKRYIPLFWITQLLSLCFYEQIFVLSMILSFILIVLNLKENKKYFSLIAPLIFNAVLYFGVTFLFKNTGSAIGSRMSIIVPSFSKGYINIFFDLLEQIKTAFFDAPLAITFKGFLRGIKIIIADGLWFLIPVIILFACGAFILCKKEENYSFINTDKKKTFLVGVITAVAPITIFFVIANPYISMRNVLPSFVGIALMLDMLFSCVAYKKKIFMQCVASGLAVLFFVASVSETHDYKAVYDFDIKAGKSIEAVMKDNEYRYKTAFIIQNDEKGSVNIKFHEHGAGVTSSDWALWGILNYFDYDNKQNNKKAIPIQTDNKIYHYPWDKEAKNLESFDKIYYWNNNKAEFVEVFVNKITDSYAEILTADGFNVASIKEHNNTGYIFFN